MRLTGSYFNLARRTPASSPQAAHFPSSPTKCWSATVAGAAAAAAAAETLAVSAILHFSPRDSNFLHAARDRTNDSHVNDVDTPTSTSQRTVMRGSK